MLKNINPETSKIIRDEINEMWEKEKIKTELKRIKTIAIQKPNRDKTKIENYRFISLINTIMKVGNSTVLKKK